MSAVGVLQASKAIAAVGTTFSTTVDLLTVDVPTVGVLVDLTALGAASTLTLTVQWSNDGNKWADADPADTFTPLAAVGTVAKAFTVKARRLRLKEVVAGASATYNASVFYVAS